MTRSTNKVVIFICTLLSPAFWVQIQTSLKIIQLATKAKEWLSHSKKYTKKVYTCIYDSFAGADSSRQAPSCTFKHCLNSTTVSLNTTHSHLCVFYFSLPRLSLSLCVFVCFRAECLDLFLSAIFWLHQSLSQRLESMYSIWQ
jgi:hypothetical protein